MCGFAGWVGMAPGKAVELRRKQVDEALRLLHHRGPDSGRSVIARGGHTMAVLGAVRLRIIDLRPESDMPMSLPDGSATLVYNGELYNTAELRANLSAQGHRFAGTSDTECILHLYEEHRERPVEMLVHLRGMFAFALWDPQVGRLFAARDRLGIKPLYFAQGEGGLVFGSEVRALARSGLVTRELDGDVGRAFLRWGVVPGDDSIVRGVRRLPAGSCLVWDGGEASVRLFWTADFTPEPALKADTSAMHLARTTLTDSVTRHLIAQRPVGVFLSGGTDSLVIATLAARQGRVRSLTLSFPDDPTVDESEPARRAADRLGLDHESVSVVEPDVADLVTQFFTGLDSPTMDGLNSWLVCRAAHRAGLVVALSGLGADELVGGYATFRRVPRIRRATSALAWLPAVGRTAVARAAAGREVGGRLARVIEATGSLDGSYAAARGLFSQSDLRSTCLPPLCPSGVSPVLHGQDAVTALEMRHFLGHQVLPDTDSVSMSHSLEVRVPYLDDQVVGSLLAVPAGTRRRMGKRLLLEAAGIAELPPKRPFSLPMDRWLNGPLRELLDEGLLSDDLPFAQDVAKADRKRIHAALPGGQGALVAPLERCRLAALATSDLNGLA